MREKRVSRTPFGQQQASDLRPKHLGTCLTVSLLLLEYSVSHIARPAFTTAGMAWAARLLGARTWRFWQSSSTSSSTAVSRASGRCRSAAKYSGSRLPALGPTPSLRERGGIHANAKTSKLALSLSAFSRVLRQYVCKLEGQGNLQSIHSSPSPLFPMKSGRADCA